ncbi:MAG: hypothetical protein HGB10_05125 [Coriobacteriia bacterium]|nr:hypothetical protein [Coriobacteriia bacterium]
MFCRHRVATYLVLVGLLVATATAASAAVTPSVKSTAQLTSVRHAAMHGSAQDIDVSDTGVVAYRVGTSIVWYDPAMDATTTITGTCDSALSPAIHGNTIVYVGVHNDHDNNPATSSAWAIHAYNIKTGSDAVISPYRIGNDSDLGQPDVWGDRVVWASRIATAQPEIWERDLGTSTAARVIVSNDDIADSLGRTNVPAGARLAPRVHGTALAFLGVPTIEGAGRIDMYTWLPDAETPYGRGPVETRTSLEDFDGQYLLVSVPSAPALERYEERTNRSVALSGVSHGALAGPNILVLSPFSLYNPGAGTYSAIGLGSYASVTAVAYSGGRLAVAAPSTGGNDLLVGRVLAPAVTLAAVPTANYGAAVVLQGVVTDEELPVAGGVVTFEASHDGGSNWTSITGTATPTSASGAYSWTSPQLTVSARYRAVYRGAAGPIPTAARHVSGMSAPIAVNVRQGFSKPTVSATRIARNKYVTVAGSHQMLRGAETYRIERLRYERGRYRSKGFTSVTLDPLRWRYSRRIKLTQTGKWKFRAVSAASTWHASTQGPLSNTVTVH